IKYLSPYSNIDLTFSSLVTNIILDFLEGAIFISALAFLMPFIAFIIYIILSSDSLKLYFSSYTGQELTISASLFSGKWLHISSVINGIKGWSNFKISFNTIKRTF